MKKSKKVLCVSLAILILAAVGVFLTIKNTKSSATDFMEGVEAGKITEKADRSEYGPVFTDFSVRLFKECYKKGSNQLISPVSVISALGMTANGAKGETLLQMEEVFGVDIETLNKYIYSFINSLAQGEKYKLSMANSIWVRDTLKNVHKEFLQTNADYYDASIYKCAFNDKALNDINSWVKDNTEGLIPKILENINPDAVMYLINALCFDAEWEEIYLEESVSDCTFTLEDGTEKNVSFMGSAEYSYIEDENATGFIKYYLGRKYAFVALLPNEEVSIEDYVATMDGMQIRKMLLFPVKTKVYTKTPKFSSEYSLEMSEILKNMGMQDAFKVTADFTGMASPLDDPLYINNVLHKTFIQVDEKGTKAGAATLVEMNANALPIEPKTVYLDRPFVYMLIDCESNIPFFIGTMMDPCNS